MINRKFNNSSFNNLENLICLSNIFTNLSPIESYCDSYDEINNICEISLKIKDKNKYIGKYLIIGDEIVKILSITENQDKTFIKVERKQFFTERTEDFINKKVRLVEVLKHNGTDILNYNFTNTTGVPNSELFPVEVSNGNLTITDDFKKWSSLSEERIYNLKSKSTVCYIFKGVNKQLLLKCVALVDKVKFYPSTKSNEKKIIIGLKSYLHKWYNNDINSTKVYSNIKPKEFFKDIFNLKDFEVMYASGVDENNIIVPNLINLKDYNKIADLLKVYSLNTTIRFAFDRFERLRLFTDYTINNFTSVENFKYNISDIMVNDDSKMIFNTMQLEINQYLPLYNSEDLNNNAIDFKLKINNAFMSNEIYTNTGTSYYPNILILGNNSLFEHTTLGDYVLAKATFQPYIELYGRVIAKSAPNKVSIQFIRWDKDFRTTVAGKDEYLDNILNSESRPMDLYYARFDLPDIFRFTRNRGGQERDYSLFYPLLPKVNGKIKYMEKVNITFGSASNFKVGEYSGSIKDIEGIYGIWGQDKLLYNQEYAQSKSQNYPPIYVLSNHIVERRLGDSYGYKWTSFDNRDLQIEIERNTDSKNGGDATLRLLNTYNVAESDLYIGTEIDRKGNNILQISNINDYKIGDVLIANFPEDNPTQLEIEEYNNSISAIKWTIKEKFIDSDNKHYILLDSPFAKRKDRTKKYSFTKFPSESIVYLQELYIKGNPIIKHSQTVSGVSSDLSVNNETSVQLYEEKKYNITTNLLEKNEVKKLMGYILGNYNGVKNTTTKYNVPLSLVNALHIEPLDVIGIDDEVYTQINSEKYKWVVVSEKISSDTNEVSFNCININNKNTEPYPLDVKEVLEYKPINIPKYSNTGGETNIGNGTTTSEKNDDIGQIWVAKIDESELSAIVEKYESGYIYFKGFDGSKQLEYKDKMFGHSLEFVVEINGEMILVESDLKYRAMIKKRQLYGTTLTNIQPEQKVGFLSITIHTDVDGTIYGRRIHIGDNNNYFKYNMSEGATFVGNFRVGAENRNTNNDLYNAINNNKVYRQESKPIDDSENKLKKGDIWYSVLEQNKPYIYNGAEWISARDGLLGNNIEFSKIIYSDEPQTIGVKDNDFWIDTNNGNEIHIRKNGVWVSFMTIPTTSVDGNKVIHSENEPISDFNYTLREGDIWFSFKEGFIRKSYRGNQWKDIRDTIIQNTLNGRHLFVDRQVPTYWQNNDIYFDLDSNSIYINNTGTQEIINDGVVSVENGNKIYLSATIPNGIINEKDLWIDTDNNFTIYYYINGSWDSPFTNLTRYVEDATNISKGIVKYASDLVAKVESMGLDNKLSPLEKQNLLKEIDILKANYTILKNKADVFLIDLTTINQYKQDLLTYIEPYLVNLTTVENVNGNLLRQHFVNYYTEYEKIINLIIDKASEKAKQDAVQESNQHIENIKNSLKQYINEQVDGKIETYYQNTDPSTAWTTTELKNKHIGDIWYNITATISYRWNGTQWLAITAKGEDEIARALAQSKSTIWTTQPTPPYKKGDFWLKNNELYVSNITREIGSFISSDFIKATKYTDDTKANQVETKIQNGQIVLNGNTIVRGDFVVRGNNVEITGQTKIVGVLKLFGGQGLEIYNGTTESTSTKKVVIKDGILEVWERT